MNDKVDSEHALTPCPEAQPNGLFVIRDPQRKLYGKPLAMRELWHIQDMARNAKNLATLGVRQRDQTGEMLLALQVQARY